MILSVYSYVWVHTNLGLRIQEIEVSQQVSLCPCSLRVGVSKPGWRLFSESHFPPFFLAAPYSCYQYRLKYKWISFEHAGEMDLSVYSPLDPGLPGMSWGVFFHTAVGHGDLLGAGGPEISPQYVAFTVTPVVMLLS